MKLIQLLINAIIRKRSVLSIMQDFQSKVKLLQGLAEVKRNEVETSAERINAEFRKQRECLKEAQLAEATVAKLQALLGTETNTLDKE